MAQIAQQGGRLWAWVLGLPARNLCREYGGCRLRMGARYPPGALIPGLRTEGETQASAEQGARLRAQPGISSQFESRTERRGLACVTQRLAEATCPSHPRALWGHQGSLWPGWVGLEEGSPTPDCSLLGLHLLGLLWHGGERGAGRGWWKEMSPTPGACLSAQAGASGFEHRYWPRQADGGAGQGLVQWFSTWATH